MPTQGPSLYSVSETTQGSHPAPIASVLGKVSWGRKGSRSTRLGFQKLEGPLGCCHPAPRPPLCPVPTPAQAHPLAPSKGKGEEATSRPGLGLGTQSPEQESHLGLQPLWHFLGLHRQLQTFPRWCNSL